MHAFQYVDRYRNKFCCVYVRVVYVCSIFMYIHMHTHIHIHTLLSSEHT